MPRRIKRVSGIRASDSAVSAVAFLAVGLALLSPPASAQGPSVEVRAVGAGMAYRLSEGRPEPGPYYDQPADATRSLHVGLGLGVRIFPEGSHGVYADAAYRFDLDVDSWLDEYGGFEIPFVVGHLGYAYRAVHPLRRRPGHRAGALTVTVGVAAGMAICSVEGAGIPAHGLVIGPSVGLGYDLHFGRFFLGWGVGYDLVFHTQGAMKRSHFVTGNVFPAGRIGWTLGRRAQPPAGRPMELRPAPPVERASNGREVTPVDWFDSSEPGG